MRVELSIPNHPVYCHQMTLHQPRSTYSVPQKKTFILLKSQNKTIILHSQLKQPYSTKVQNQMRLGHSSVAKLLPTLKLPKYPILAINTPKLLTFTQTLP